MNEMHLILRKLLYLIMAPVALFFVCSPAQATPDDEWEIRVAPYFFFANPNYDATLDGRTVPVDLSFSDIWDDFDVIAGSLRIEGWKGDWGIIADGIITSLDGDFDPDGRVNVAPKLTDIMIDLMGAYRLPKLHLFDRPFITEVSAGLRYHYLKQKARVGVSLPGPGPLPGRNKAKRLGDSEDWIEPIIGARVRWSLTEKWTWINGGDMSGFGIGSASKLTWSVNSVLNYQFARHWSFAFGYRYLNMDYSKGSGASEFGFDGYIDGVLVGFTWRN